MVGVNVISSSPFTHVFATGSTVIISIVTAVGTTSTITVSAAVHPKLFSTTKIYVSVSFTFVLLSTPIITGGVGVFAL